MRYLKAFFIPTLGCMLPAMGQGPLNPVSGPAPMMRTLDQVEPRTPISELPFTISEPGSYYVTDNLEVTGNGILVESDNVSIDLNGFTMRGSGSGLGVRVAGFDNVRVRNGGIHEFNHGIYKENSNYGRLEALALSNHTGNGIWIRALSGTCNGHRIRDVTVSNNGSRGLNLEAGSEGVASGNVLAGVRAIGNSFNGIRISANGGVSSGNVVRDGWVQGNLQFTALDIIVENGGRSGGNIIENMRVVENVHSGLRLIANGSDSINTGNIVRNNQVKRNGNQTPGLSVVGSSNGQANGNLLEGNAVHENLSWGIYLNSSLSQGTSRGNAIRNSTVSGNHSYGIRLGGNTEGTRVENNVVSDHPTGIRVDSSKSFVFTNTLFGNSAGIMAGSGNLVAPLIVGGTGEIPNTTNPWANFAP
ncbi:MAG: right-handed parallel beta-helix repeat-containing protein [Verrucomicrobia bacterium]|nr:right-handed parallel beta-helix repeat-containing protein [Verrucomicrobiota bacterium]MCH8511236.1 right-handed parallel beta-helix repeat-containing protein [Kiritimatiellia bacterium]